MAFGCSCLPITSSADIVARMVAGIARMDLKNKYEAQSLTENINFVEFCGFLYWHKNELAYKR
jgi:hypothetical protein